ncbi:MAG: hypothetical protein ACTSU2_13375 [Promethearchaeota archaeon]
MDVSMKLDNLQELFVQIFKIIGIRNISINELVFKMSYEMGILSPSSINSKIKSAIKEGLLELHNKSIISLSNTIKQRLIKNDQFINKYIANVFPEYLTGIRIEDALDNWWAEITPEKITGNYGAELSSADTKDNHLTIVPLDPKYKDLKYNELIKKALTPDEINHGKEISIDLIHITNIDETNKIITFNIESTKSQNTYNLVINLKDRSITHDCMDFQKRKKFKKLLCKHFLRSLQKLRKINPNLLYEFLLDFAENRENWFFN